MTRVVCAGVAVFDIVMYVDEMPRLAEKYRARDAALVGGGNAANASVAIARLGGNACLAARLGDDQIGDLIVQDLQSDGVDCNLVRRFEGRRSSFSSIMIDAAGERQIVNYRDTEIDADAAWLSDDRLPEFDAALADTRWPQGAAVLLRCARDRGKPAVLDGESPFDLSAEAVEAATHLAFSAQGLRDFAGSDNLDEGLRKAAQQTKAWVCVTDGEDGVTWLQNGQLGHVPAFRIDAIDTLGAGDTWHGAFALALGEGKGEVDAISFANAAAAIKCSRSGGRGGAPNRDEVAAFLQVQRPNATR